MATLTLTYGSGAGRTNSFTNLVTANASILQPLEDNFRAIQNFVNDGTIDVANLTNVNTSTFHGAQFAEKYVFMYLSHFALMSSGSVATNCSAGAEFFVPRGSVLWRISLLVHSNVEAASSLASSSGDGCYLGSYVYTSPTVTNQYLDTTALKSRLIECWYDVRNPKRATVDSSLLTVKKKTNAPTVTCNLPVPGGGASTGDMTSCGIMFDKIGTGIRAACAQLIFKVPHTSQ